jgi:predicted alpha/beta-fold hydrolase
MGMTQWQRQRDQQQIVCMPHHAFRTESWLQHVPPTGDICFRNPLSRVEAFMVNRRSFSGLLTAIAVASVIPGIVQAKDTPVAPNVVLVHGLYADGSSWIDVIPYLQRAGLKVTAVQPYTFEDGSGLTALAEAHRT